MKTFPAAMTIAVFLATSLWAREVPKPPELQVAALAMPLGARADWQQWDSFLTFVVKRLGQEFRADQRDELGETFLDARYQLVQALNAGISDPVPQLFLDTWRRLSPILKQALPGVS